jgi:hypothetical protein
VDVLIGRRRPHERVKYYIVFLLMPVVLLGSTGQSLNQPATSFPSSNPSLLLHRLQFIESAETKAQNEIKSQALALFTNRDYDSLEKMAADYRSSNEQFADGTPKLSLVYAGLEPAEQDSEQVWQRCQIQMQQWIHAKPESVTPRIAMARVLTSYAWKARGGGWAYEVKEEDWQTFFARLRGAQNYLEQAEKLKERCPVFWTTLQRIALGLQVGRKKYDAIFNQARREFPNYEAYYNNRAICLLPGWHGAAGEWESDLAKSADKIGGEAGDVLYARVIWYVHTAGVSTNIFKETPRLSWPRVQRGFDGILKESPDSLAAKTERAHLAALKGDKTRARVFFLETKGQVDFCLWDGGDAFHSNFKWIFGR